jgi:hypothetical protein
MKRLAPCSPVAPAASALGTLVCIFCLTLCCAAGAGAQTTNQDIYAVTYESNNQQQLVRFNRATPGAITVIGTISKPSCGGRIAGLDFRPATRQLYGVCDTTKTLVIDTTTAVATLVGTASSSLYTSDAAVGYDFDPRADEIRAIYAFGRNNNRVNPTTGAINGTDTSLAWASGDPNAGVSTPRVGAIAYTNNSAGTTQTTLYGIDTNKNALVTIGTANGAESPNTGLVHTVAPLVDASNNPLDVSDSETNLDIAPDGTAFLEADISGSSNLYTLDLTSGVATLVGAITRPDPVTANQFSGGFAGISVTTSPVCTAAPSGMIAWYPGDGNARDIQGGNNGTFNGTYAPGKVNQAFSLNGDGQYVSAPSAPSNSPTNLTLDGWFNFTSTSGIQVLIAKTAGTGPNESYALFYNAGTLGGLVGGPNGIGPILYTNFTPTPGTWYHLAYTFDDATDTQSLYINGAQAATGTTTATPVYDSHPLTIGTEYENEQLMFFFPGKIDEVEVFNRALTPSEIQSIYNADAQGKCKAAVTNGAVLISEFRFQGETATDEFIELYNNTDAPINLGGYSVVINLLSVALDSTTLPARGHYLLAFSPGYTLSSYAAPDQDYSTTLAGGAAPDSSVRLLNASGQVLDKVGFTTSLAGTCEGACLTPTSALGQYSFVRLMTTGLPQDTDNNAADFVLVSPDTANVPGSRLGAPGPENSTSPVNRGANIKSSLFASCLPVFNGSTAPNRERNSNPYTDTLTPSSPTGTAGVGGPPNSSYTLGMLRLRRRFTNGTGQDVTRLRFRVVDMTAGAGGAGTADLRLLTSPNETGVVNPCGTMTTQGLTVEQVPTQMFGGGLNTTVAAGTITTNFPLASGNSIDLNFLLGVAQTGSFRFFVIVEALPNPPAPAASSSASMSAADLDSAKDSHAPARAKSLPASKGGRAKGGQ